MKLIAPLGWLLAVLFGVGCIMLYARVEALKEGVQRDSEQSANFSNQLALVQEIQQQQANTSPGQTLAGPLSAQDPPSPTPPAVPETGAAEAASAPDPEPEKDDAEPELNEQQQRMMQAQTSALGQMLYGDFLTGLNLPQETLDAVNAEIQDVLGRSMLLGQQALTREPPWTGKEFGERNDALRAALRESLAAHLSPEQLAAWDDVDAAATQTLYGNMVGGQLAMLLPGLNEEARLTMQSVLGEELALRLDALETSEEPYDRHAFVEAQRTALEEGAARLREALNDEEFAQLERYMQQAEQTFQALAPES